MKRLVLPAILALAAVAAIFLLGGEREHRPNVILIVIDTLRRDHVGAYGYQRPTTPVIDRLAAENILFTNAYANSNWTKPSIASLMTGLLVSQHGVKYVVTDDSGAAPMTQALSDDAATLAEALDAAGYHTIAAIENVHVSAKLGFSQGFDIWDEELTSAANLTNQFLHRIDELEEPFCAYLHYFDPHTPYYRTRTFEGPGEILPGLLESLSTDATWATYTFGVDRSLIGLSPVERERLVALYDGQIRSVDFNIGRILETLRRKGMYDNSLIIITADHGENFHEGGRLTHPHDCFADPQVRVPFIIKTPHAREGGGRTIDDTVQLIDVAPTVLAYLGLDDMPGLAGIDITPAIKQGLPLPIRAVTAASEAGRMILSEGYKYSEVPSTAGVFKFLYERARDPLEERNLVPANRDIAARLAAAASSLDEAARARLTVQQGAGIALTAQELQKLRSLGYVGN